MNNPWSESRPPIVCLCGSRSSEAIDIAETSLTLAGKIVLTPFVHAHLASRALTPQDRAMLTEVHRAKLDIADEAVVINPAGHVGEAAAHEIAYALHRSIPVSFTVPVMTMHLQQDYFDAMVAGKRSIEIRRLDAKRATLGVSQAVRFYTDTESLLARVTTLTRSPSTASLLDSTNPAHVIPGGDRAQLAAEMEARWPGILTDDVPMLAIGLNVLGTEPALVAEPA